MKKILPFILGLIILAGLAVGGYFIYKHYAPKKSEPTESTQKIEELEKQITELQAVIAELNNQKDVLNSDGNTLRTQIIALNNQITALQNYNNELLENQVDLTTLQNQVNNLNAMIYNNSTPSGIEDCVMIIEFNVTIANENQNFIDSDLKDNYQLMAKGDFSADEMFLNSNVGKKNNISISLKPYENQPEDVTVIKFQYSFYFDKEFINFIALSKNQDENFIRLVLQDKLQIFSVLTEKSIYGILNENEFITTNFTLSERQNRHGVLDFSYATFQNLLEQNYIFEMQKSALGLEPNIISFNFMV